MQVKKKFSELKRMSKLQLQGKFGTLIGALLLQMLIIIIVNEVVSSILSGNDALSITINFIIQFIVDLLLGTLSAGLCYLQLLIACNKECKVSDLFYVVQHMPDKAIKVRFVISIIENILMIPSIYYNRNYGYKILNYYDQLINEISKNPYGDFSAYTNVDLFTLMGIDITTFFIIDILLIVSGILLMIVGIGFFPAFYMMVDFPSMTVKEVLSNSWKLMKGNKLRYLGLTLSFLPFYILSVFTLCIPLVWVIPYQRMTYTNFYLDLVAVHNSQGDVATE